MLFSSITFLYLFLPVCLVVYFVTPHKYKNHILLLFSMIFYGFETPKFILMMLFCMCLTYINGLIIDKYRNKIHYIVSIVLSLAPLVFFKYINFFISNTNSIFKTDIKILNLVLPLGISFYTFQMLTYIIDLWNNKVEKERSFFDFALYVSFFPQLIAGPIVTYNEIQDQLKNRTESIEKAGEGFFIFVVGLGKKVLLANQLGELVGLYNPSETTILLTWLYAIAYSLQVYFDFSGYSTMAIGIGKIFGFELPINFNYPFISKTITEFWRRWHITLSSFFKNYIYIPLGGNRVKTSRYILNMFIVWALTGFWHGADWNFIFWGLSFFVVLMVEKFIIKDHLNKIPLIQRILTLLIIIMTFVLFNSSNISESFLVYKNMFSGILFDSNTLYILRNYLFIIIISIIGSTPLIHNFYQKKIKDTKFSVVFEPLFMVSILLISTSYLVDGSFNPFLYFRF